MIVWTRSRVSSAGIAALVGMFIVAPVQAEESLCGRVAATLRVGEPSPASMLDRLPDLIPAVESDDAPAILSTLTPDTDLLTKADEMAADDMRVDFYLSPGSTLGAIDAVRGTAKCQTIIFFEIKAGRAVAAPAPSGLNSEGACWGDNVSLMRMGSTPYAVEVMPVGDRARRVIASSWSAGAWSSACTVTETYSVRLAEEHFSCAPGRDCKGLRANAMQQAQAAQREHERLTPALGVVAAAAEVPAIPADLPSEIPTFDLAYNSYTTLDMPRIFSLLEFGQKLVGAVGGGRFGWRSYEGWLVGYWLQDTGGYHPVAGAQVARHFGLTESIHVTGP